MQTVLLYKYIHNMYNDFGVLKCNIKVILKSSTPKTLLANAKLQTLAL